MAYNTLWFVGFQTTHITHTHIQDARFNGHIPGEPALSDELRFYVPQDT